MSSAQPTSGHCEESPSSLVMAVEGSDKDGKYRIYDGDVVKTAVLRIVEGEQYVFIALK